MLDWSTLDEVLDDFVNADSIPDASKLVDKAPFASVKARDELLRDTDKQKAVTFKGIMIHFAVLGFAGSVGAGALTGAAYLMNGNDITSANVDMVSDVAFHHQAGVASNTTFWDHGINTEEGHAFELADDLVARNLAANSTDAGHGSSGNHRSPAFYPVAYMLLVYASSAFCKWGCSKLPAAIQPPHSLLLFIFGMLLGYFARSAWTHIELGEVISEFSDMDPHIIFWLLLPALLFEDSCKANWHVTKRVLPSSLLLAIPGVMVNTCLTAAFLMALGTWNWEQSLLLGSIASATDPVAVVAALHTLHAPEKLEALIAAESLFNDGSAVVLFSLFLKAANGTQALEPGYAIKFFIQLSFCGPLMGLAFGLGMYIWLKTTRDYQTEVLVMTVAVFGSFFLAEHPSIHVSGVLAVVVLGFFMSVHGRFAFERANLEKHYTIIGFLSLLSHEAIFVVAGVVTDNFIWSDLITGKDWLELFFFYFLVHFTRASVICLFYPSLVRLGYGLMWKEALLCIYGGLRGAVGLAMALLVHGDKRIGDYDRARCAFHVAGLALLTLLINGTTWPLLYRKLHVYPHKGTQRALLIRACTQMDEAAHAHIQVLKRHWFFCSCKFEYVDRLVPKISFQEKKRKKDGHVHDVSLQDHFKHANEKPSQEFIADTLAEVARETAADEEVREDGAHGCRIKAQDMTAVDLMQANLFSPTAAPAPLPSKQDQDITEDDHTTHDIEQSKEHIQTVINAAGQAYHSMFTTRTIRERPYLSLKDSINLAEEALNGELKKSKFLKEYDDLATLVDNPESQIRKVFQVSWRFLVYRATAFEGFFWRTLDFIDKIVPLPDVRAKAEWNSMARYVEALLVWIMTHEQLLSEMSMLSHLPAWNDLCETVTVARVELLELFAGQDVISLEYEMFSIFQHILAARCALVKKVLVLFDNVRMGLLTHDSAKMVVTAHIRPQMHALKHYRPSKALRQELRKQAGTTHANVQARSVTHDKNVKKGPDTGNATLPAAQGATRRDSHRNSHSSHQLSAEYCGQTASLRHQHHRGTLTAVGQISALFHHHHDANHHGQNDHHKKVESQVTKEDIERMKQEAVARAKVLQAHQRRPGEQAGCPKQKAEKNWQTGMKKALAVSRMAKAAGGNVSQIQKLSQLPQTTDAGTGASDVVESGEKAPSVAPTIAKASTGEAPINSPEPAAGSTMGSAAATASM
eukprot:gnl/MRDRNA2_/MRDRNA2_105332_c0_seq1.p1 gnl/MRDRNA2_/MRDRNA2_105332_c0~~gnl/MRDRNA2_/MRDRNA2_105332_c0_seq1.p1  ORF type:complete len:1202 (-),score=202.90 gnl/MRDRNA2_/MRDRNA2_105332_c0_seq1:175-3780(-)